MLNEIMQRDVMLSVIMLSVFMPGVIKLSVYAEFCFAECHHVVWRYAE